MKKRWESSKSATSATLPSKRNKREANEPESVEGESESDEQEIFSVPDDVGPSGHELREPDLEPNSVQGDLEPKQEGTSARSADASTSEPFREPALEPLEPQWEPKH